MNTLQEARLGYHLVRRVQQPESPYDGMLARDDAGMTVLLVKVGEPGGWPVTRVAGDTEHGLMPFDVLAHEEWHEVVLPWCSETVEAFLARRRRAAQPLSAGEAVTLGVCVLRGAQGMAIAPSVTAASRGPATVSGAWWLMLDGRPVFSPDALGAADRIGEGGGGALNASGAGSASIAEVHAATLRAIAEACRDAGVEAVVETCAERLLDAAQNGDREHAPGRWAATILAVLEMCEDDLFQLSEAAPLETRSLRPRPSRSLHGDFASLLAEPAAETSATAEDASTGRVWRFLSSQIRQGTARHIDPEIADVATETWRRTRRGVAGVVRRPLVVALGLALLIVMVGALWPDDRRVSAADANPTTGVADATEAEEIPPGESDRRGEPADAGDQAALEAAPGDEARALEGIAAAANALLVARVACNDDTECTAHIYEDAAAPVGRAGPRDADEQESHRRPLDVPPHARALTLIDDLGGVAVLRVSLATPVAGEVNAEMLIIVNTERGWRIRDVFDVLDAPPSDSA